MVLRISVTIHGVPEKFLIACTDGQKTIQWLCETAYNRYTETYFAKTVPCCFVARRMTDRSLLSLEDHVEDILDDNEGVEIGKVYRSFSFPYEFYLV